MPITNEGTVVYKMPKEIKDVITPAFLYPIYERASSCLGIFS